MRVRRLKDARRKKVELSRLILELELSAFKWCQKTEIEAKRSDKRQAKENLRTNSGTIEGQLTADERFQDACSHAEEADDRRTAGADWQQVTPPTACSDATSIRARMDKRPPPGFHQPTCPAESQDCTLAAGHTSATLCNVLHTWILHIHCALPLPAALPSHPG